jgi:hypothetical protein
MILRLDSVGRPLRPSHYVDPYRLTLGRVYRIRAASRAVVISEATLAQGTGGTMYRCVAVLGEDAPPLYCTGWRRFVS